MLDKRKQGEEEAMRILKAKGISFNEKHNDEGDKGYSVPDLQYSDGRYLEVTHTLHNNSIPTTISRFDRLQPGEDWSGYTKRHLDVETECNRAYNRIRKINYEMDER